MRLAAAVPAGDTACREVAAASDDAFPLAMAWAMASSWQLRADPQHGARLIRWWKSFAGRPPLLGGDEVAAALGLATGPARAAAIRALRLAQARGEVRTAAHARAWLRRHEAAGTLW
jgi:hypothetical protein